MTYAKYGAAYNTIMNALRSDKFDIVEETLSKYKTDKKFSNFLFENINKNMQAFKGCVGVGINNSININKQCAILKYLSFEQQLELTKHHIKARLPHIEVALNSANCDKEKLFESWGYLHALSYHFRKEDFTAIDQLNNLIEKNVLTQKYGFGYFHGAYPFVDDKKALIARLVYFDNKNYTPLYNIIYDYSDAKKEYLLSQDIALPNIEQAQDITNRIINSLETTGSYDNYDEYYLKAGLENYKKIILYNELQESLPHNNSKIYRPKI